MNVQIGNLQQKEYSVAKGAAFCLCCYLFKPDIRDQAGGDSFVGGRFSNSKKKEKIQTHVGGLNRAHNPSKCQDLQGLAFRGHDEFENSSNQGNFLVLPKFLTDHNEDVKVVALSNALQNLKLTSLEIQKDIVNVAAFQTINVIIRDLGDALFSILIDETRDISMKEQMVVVIRYVDKKGQVIKHFFGLRGQGYDRASNMQGEFNGLKTLILKENPCAYYVHCFAHQLQLALIAVPKNHNQIALLFTLVSNVMNVVGASCKRRDIVREKQATKVVEALNIGEHLVGKA
ncbi:zinc finger MYM-type protein 1-like [Camellia sinensis]|uniref:zinc finger MYM-type protein 1-like n=1 Tax=Camellia sinensis TaxID=4442 RepID=UPI001035F6E3|nr:zinc finger MYM-type protein 1-like [Camellia sinensis]